MSCPDDDELLAIVEGGLDAASREPIAAHLETCPECLEVVTALLRAQGKTRDTPLLPGAEWAGRYRVSSVLGRGAMGDVYAARDGKLDRDVALKVLADAGELMSPLARDRFARESRVMARLDHPHLITVFDADVYNGRPYVAMQLIEGSTMRTWAPPQPWRRVVDAYAKVAAGLATAHAAGVLHRDIKPDNILVDDSGSPVLTDFGLATTDSPGLRADRDPQDRLTRPGAAIGTPAYMAPERLDGDPASARSDVYEFAASLYESLYGYPPSRPARVDTKARGRRLPRGLRQALARALAPEPAQRFDGVLAVRRALQAPERQRRWLAAATGVATIAVLSGFIGTGLAAAGAKPPCDTRPATDWWRTEGQPHLSQHAFGSDLTPRLADHVAEWETTRQAVCEASRDGVGSRTSTERQLACLDTDLQHTIGLTQAIEDEDGWRAAMLAVDRLRSPRRCLETDRVLAEAPLPETPAERDRVGDLRDRIARVEGQLAAGAADVSATLSAIRTEVDDLGFAPLQAEVRFLEAESEARRGRPAQAQRFTLEAMHEAEAARHDVLVAKAAAALTPRTANLGQHERAEEYASRAEASLARLGGMFPGLQATATNNRGIAAHKAGDFERARGLFARAVELHGFGSAPAAESKIGLAGALFQLGRVDEGLTLRREALDELVEHRGERHPQVLTALTDLAGVHLSLGRTDEAAPVMARAIDLTRAILGVEHPDYARLLSMRGVLRQATGDAAGALLDFDAALPILEAAYGTSHVRVAMALDGRAGVLAALGRTDEAIESSRRVLASAIELYDGPHPRQASLGSNLSRLLIVAEQPEEAARVAEDAVATLDATVGERHPLMITALARRGHAERLVGRVLDARATLERALELSVAVPVDARMKANASFRLAEAMAASGDAERAEALAADAAEAIAAIDPEDASGLGVEIEAWQARSVR